jgi:5-(carboxyamino)imidazole ribonucleotide mutase
MVAAHTDLPVLGVPIANGALVGVDALLSIVQMPRGIPVATVSIGGAFNAGVLAAQILGCSQPAGRGLAAKLRAFKDKMQADVLGAKS